MFEVEVLKTFYDLKEGRIRNKGEIFICDKERYCDLLKKNFITQKRRTKKEEAAHKQELIKLSNPYSKKRWETKKIKHKISPSRLKNYNSELVKEYLSELYLRKISLDKLNYRVKNFCKDAIMNLEYNNYNSKKITVDYIRHNLTNYDVLLSRAGQIGKKEKAEIHYALKVELYEMIKNSYPSLSTACGVLKKHDEKVLTKNVKKY